MSYVKTTWVTGDIVTAPKLNNLENGVYNNDQKISELETSESTLQGNMAAPYDATATYAVGDYCTYEGQLQRCIVPIETPEAWDSTHWEAAALGEDINNLKEGLNDYAKVDGYYEQMSVGQADELITAMTEEEAEPFIFRTSGGSLEIGSREELTVVGGSLPWNQLAQNGNFATTANWTAAYCTFSVENNVATIAPSNTTNGLTLQQSKAIEAHVYLETAEVYTNAPTGNISIDLRDGTAARSVANTTIVGEWVKLGGIYKVTTPNPTGYIRIYHNPVSSIDGVECRIKNFNFIDLTQTFGTTIADYIYSLEQSTAGAGFAWFKKLFSKDYYPYQTADLVHVNASKFKTVGFNQWDEEYVASGYFNASGRWVSSSEILSSKNPISVLPNTTYYAYVETSGVELYATYWRTPVPSEIGNTAEFIKRVKVTNNTFVIPSDCHAIHFNVNAAYGTTYKNDICISIHWDNTRDGEYEPYTVHSYPLDSNLVLRGIPKIDADGNLYYDGDTYEANGTVTRRYGIVDLGTLTWSGYAGYPGLWYVNNSGLGFVEPSGNTVLPSAICSKYVGAISRDIGTTGHTKGEFALASPQRIYISDDSYSDAATFKASLSGVYLVYELQTSTTETATPYQTPQIVDNWGTEEFVVTTQNGVEVPVGHNTVYPISLKDKLEASPNLPDGDGDYVLRMSGGEASYAPVISEIPAVPTSEDGSYVLKATVASGAITYAWETQA